MSEPSQQTGLPREKIARSSRRILKWLAAVAIFVVLLPEIIRFALIQFLPNTGVGKVEIADIDLNLFMASAGVDGLVITRDDNQKLALDHLALDLSWLKLLLGEFQFDAIEIDGLRVPVSQLSSGTWEIVLPLQGTEQEPSPASDQANDEGIALPKVLVRAMDVRNVVFPIESELIKGTFAIDELVLQEASSWLLEPATLSLKAHWKDAPIELNLSARPWIDVPEASGQLSVEGYQMGTLSTLLGVPVSGTLDVSLDFSVSESEDRYVANVPVKLKMRETTANYKVVNLQQSLLEWSGDVEVSVSPDSEPMLTYTVKGDLKSDGLVVQDTRHDRILVQWEHLGLDKLELDQSLGVRFDKLELTKLDALDTDDESDRFYTESLLLNGFALEAGKQLHLRNAEIGGGEYNLEITPQGDLHFEGVIAQLLEDLQDQDVTAPAPAGAESAADEPPAEDSAPVADAAAVTADAPDAAAEPAFSFGIDRLLVKDNTRISLVDRRFSPPVKQDMFIKQLIVENLDQRQPDSKTKIKLQSSVGEFGKFNAEGVAKPFAEALMIDLEGEIHALELPNLSPYSEAYLGYHLTRGQYDHKFDLKLENQDIKLKNKLLLRQLELESVDPDKPQPIEKQLDVPLGIALDMLRDSHNNIELNVPIKGRLDDPDININNVINKALAKAVTNGATSYLKFALQPYGAVLMAADFVGDQIKAVRLEPVLFDPGSDEAPSDLDYIAKLEQLLADRPALELTLCGRSNSADQQALQESSGAKGDKLEAALQKLAERRAKRLKRLFIDKGVESSRLLLCQSKYEADGVNGVQMQM